MVDTALSEAINAESDPSFAWLDNISPLGSSMTIREFLVMFFMVGTIPS